MELSESPPALLDDHAWPRWWRWGVVASAVLVLCSCRGVPDAEETAERHEVFKPPLSPAPMVAETLPHSAYTGGADPNDLHHVPHAAPFWATQWAPPGIRRPWPVDEYIHDGGDRRVEASVGEDWLIHNLDLEDTIAHYDTIDGRRVLEPSNRVHIYAPRFGAVRTVSLPEVQRHRTRHGRLHLPQPPLVEEERLAANTTMQPLMAVREIGRKRPRVQQLNDPPLQVGSETALMSVQNRFKLHENFRVIREGIVEQSEEAWLAKRIEGAKVWNVNQGVQVIIDEVMAHALVGDSQAQVTYTIDTPTAPRLRIIKTASREVARPGELVEFTLRFDNIGTEMVGNVTIVDNLTTRLEYLPDSQQCTLEHDFFTQVNEGDSLVLRWEIIDPLGPGQGGIIRFKCRVR